MTDEEMRRAVSAVWERSRDSIFKRVSVVEAAALAVLAGTLTPDARRDAEREAHKLAGSVGSFGFKDASAVARAIETLLSGDAPIAAADVLRLSNLTAQLRKQLEGGEVSPHAKLLVVTNDLEFRDRVSHEARSLGVDVLAATTADQARDLLAGAVDAAVLDLTSGDVGLRFLLEIQTAHPGLPVVVIASGDAFQDRIDAARLGGRGFLQKPVRASQIIDLLRDSLVSREEMPTIVAVDDDPDFLVLIEALLTPIGANVVRCGNPIDAMNFLVEHAPDLVMLDVDMPGFNGIELCRVLRNDPRWAAVPVLFLTAHTEPADVLRMFEAGADDFVAKPVLGPELVARVRNRLERTRMLRLAADVDSLTGVATRRRGIELLERFFRLAQRQRQPISVAAIDLDRFKAVNDRFGHLAGDMVLRRVAAILSACFRGEDIVARWGGEEFVVAMYGMPRDAAARRLTLALEKLRGQSFETGETSFTVTFSAGVAEFPHDGTDWTTLYRVADDALGRAKDEGRNRVIAAATLQAP